MGSRQTLRDICVGMMRRLAEDPNDDRARTPLFHLSTSQESRLWFQEFVEEGIWNDYLRLRGRSYIHHALDEAQSRCFQNPDDLSARLHLARALEQGGFESGAKTELVNAIKLVGGLVHVLDRELSDLRRRGVPWSDEIVRKFVAVFESDGLKLVGRK